MHPWPRQWERIHCPCSPSPRAQASRCRPNLVAGSGAFGARPRTTSFLAARLFKVYLPRGPGQRREIIEHLSERDEPPGQSVLPLAESLDGRLPRLFLIEGHLAQPLRTSPCVLGAEPFD